MEKNQFSQLGEIEVNNWSTRRPPILKKITGKFCHLEPLNVNTHKTQLFDVFQNQDESFTYVPFGPFNTQSIFDNWLNDTSLYEVCFVIFGNNSDMPLGLISYHNINVVHGTIEMGVSYSKLLQKTTAGTEAMYLMMNEVFENLHYRRLQWHCSNFNQPSRNAALRLGFRFEGIIRQQYVFKERSHDTAWYSILDSEWPNIKTRLEQWLQPNNFDLTGNQVIRLRDI